MKTKSADISNIYRLDGRVPAAKIISKIVSFEELPQAIAHLDACPGDWLKLIALL